MAFLLSLSHNPFQFAEPIRTLDLTACTAVQFDYSQERVNCFWWALFEFYNQHSVEENSSIQVLNCPSVCVCVCVCVCDMHGMRGMRACVCVCVTCVACVCVCVIVCGWLLNLISCLGMWFVKWGSWGQKQKHLQLKMFSSGPSPSLPTLEILHCNSHQTQSLLNTADTPL